MLEDLPLAPTRWALPMLLLEVVLVGHAKSLAAASGPARSDSVVVDALGERSAGAVLGRVAASFARGRARLAISDVPHLQVVDAAWIADDLAAELAGALFAWCRAPPRDAREPSLGDAVRALSPDASQSASAIFCAFVSTPAEREDGAAFQAAVRAVAAMPSPRGRQIMVYARLWLTQYLGHVLRKVNRVGYGLLDFGRGLLPSGAGSALLSRRMVRRCKGGCVGAGAGAQRPLLVQLAVPFIAKDVPSQTSEFSHPEVRRKLRVVVSPRTPPRARRRPPTQTRIGLTTLAYAHEGLRTPDCAALVRHVKTQLEHQRGPMHERPAYVLFEKWRGGGGDAVSVPSAAFPSLDLFQVRAATASRRPQR